MCIQCVNAAWPVSHLRAEHDDVGQDVHGQREDVEVGERHERSSRVENVVFVAQHERREAQDGHL